MAAQDGDEIRALVELGASATRLHGDAAATLDLGLGLTLTPGLAVGGAARLLLDPVAIGEIAFQEVELLVGYGGLFVSLARPIGDGAWGWSGTLLLGAGNADVRDVSSSQQLDSDNFLVIEPSLAVQRRLLGRLNTRVALAWRAVAGVQDLRGVDGADLRGPTISLILRLDSL